ncbi:UDP-glucose 4-epimerase GalE [Castellaniella sp.]|uniref:UDP-glucose 4-epimerase GalE n=1 Tax=Castellaniella sp. TaxID=1955812 RepID=UPI002AFEAF4F|nr:UDP-glucose 4-epimerase GalE [Castellaniella sp.]
MNILLTGGTGYIGSHTATVLAQQGHRVVLFDNLSNSDEAVVGQLARILGAAPVFVRGDVRDEALLERTLRDHEIQAVIHFAGLKAVGESVEKPLDYFSNNVQGTLSLLQAMRTRGVRTLVFSSSATVYGEPQYLPLDESHPTGATNPYGRSKLHIEEILGDLAASDPSWRVACLRYFNPVGAHDSGLIGENPRGVPNNLMPYVAQVATGLRAELNVFGDDYPTPDGTGVRDYIHVMDLAEGHAAALSFLADRTGWHAVNLGTGQGHSVLDVVHAFEQASGRPVPYRIQPRRPGDVAACYADPAKARRDLGWAATRTLEDMCRSTWRYQRGAG